MAKIRQAGFTLLELMIVVAIVAVLAMIAVPAYRQYILRGHRTDATKALQELAAREEDYYFSNNIYTNSLSNLGSSSSAAGEYYTVSIPSASSTDYTLQATVQGTQAQDTSCTSFRLTRAGVQSSGGTATSDVCWGRR
jgi:type IV pilus assembly protein PilE